MGSSIDALAFLFHPNNLFFINYAVVTGASYYVLWMIMIILIALPILAIILVTVSINKFIGLKSSEFKLLMGRLGVVYDQAGKADNSNYQLVGSTFVETSPKRSI